MHNSGINIQATGQHLKNLANQYGFTRKVLADALDVTPNTITHYYSGRSLPPTSKLLKLSDLFMLPVANLLIAEDTKPVQHNKSRLYSFENLGSIYSQLQPEVKKDIEKRIMDGLLSGYSINSYYIQRQISYAFESLKCN